jgi:ubiquinone/menaquinone biosynthesis C-methylase UbiE/uncharacterized protein YbaR (Trm112 family)
VKAETLSLLRSPGDRQPLRIDTETGPAGEQQQVLFAAGSGRTFPIRDGIPVLLDQSQVTGFNLRYQGFYNRIAGLYDGVMGLFGLLAGGGQERFRREYLDQLEIRDGARVLEVSIGTGANLRYLPTTAQFYGLDLSWGMLKRCQRNLRRWNREADLIMGNAEDLPLRDEAFDCVFHVGGINAFNDRAKALTEMVRVAKPGARLLVVDETARMMESLSWAPTARKWLREHADRFAAPVDQLPPGMLEVQASQIVRGNMYCLTFSKPS